LLTCTTAAMRSADDFTRERCTHKAARGGCVLSQ